MANTLNNLIPVLYEAVDIVSRELVGFIPAVSGDHSMDRAALNQTITSFVTPTASASDVTPGVTAPNDGDQTIGSINMTISRSKYVPIRWNGEEELSLKAGVGRRAIIVNQFAQGMRTLTNLIEADLASLHITTSRAWGTPSTTPFATDLSDTANLRKILDDNGAGSADRHVVFDTTAGAKLRSMGQLTKVNEAGDAALLRRGALGSLHGFDLHESAQVGLFTKGTGASYTTNTAGYAKGSTSITLITGAGTILAGDVIQFAGDANKYVVAVALGGGTVILAGPGIQQAIPASAVAVTVLGNSTRSMAFTRQSLLLATRAPALPSEGDMADDATFITDPVSGISFEVRLYRQYRQIRYEIAVAWGYKNVKPEHTALLLG